MGAAFGSLGSLLRGFLVFFSGSGALWSFAFGLGPGFLRGWPLAVKPRACVAGDAFAGVGVLVPTPTPPADARTVEVGVPCSGECGGELRLPGEDASPTSMARNRARVQRTEETRREGRWPCLSLATQNADRRLCRAEGVERGEVEARAGVQNSTPKMGERLGKCNSGQEHQSRCLAGRRAGARG